MITHTMNHFQTAWDVCTSCCAVRRATELSTTVQNLDALWHTQNAVQPKEQLPGCCELVIAGPQLHYLLDL